MAEYSRYPAQSSNPLFPVHRFGDRIVLPTDVLIADKFAEDAATKVVKSGEIPDGWMVRTYCNPYTLLLSGNISTD